MTIIKSDHGQTMKKKSVTYSPKSTVILLLWEHDPVPGSYPNHQNLRRGSY